VSWKHESTYLKPNNGHFGEKGDISLIEFISLCPRFYWYAWQ